MYRHCNSWIAIYTFSFPYFQLIKFNGLFNFRIEYGKEIIRIINKISVNATTDILKLEEMIKVKKEGKNLVSMFLRIMKNVIY